MHAYIHAYTHTYTHTYKHTYIKCMYKQFMSILKMNSLFFDRIYV